MKGSSKPPGARAPRAGIAHWRRRAEAYLRHSRRHSRIRRGCERLQLRWRCALAREVLQRHQGLRALARVIVIEPLAQVRYHGLNSRVTRPKAAQVPRCQTADEGDPIARPRDQGGDDVGVFRLDSRQRSGRPYTDETLRVPQSLDERGGGLARRGSDLRQRVRGQPPLQRIAALQCCDPVASRNSQVRRLPDHTLLVASQAAPCSRRSRLNAALISPMCVNACGKLTSASPECPVCSAYSPKWLA